MMTRAAMMLIALGLSACAATPKASTTAAPVLVAPPVATPTGLDRVMGRSAGALISLFGNPDQDLREENSRKLQFGSGICVLDAYLYTPAKGKEPLVSHIDARQPDGTTIDKASCVAALTRRREAR